MATSSETAPQAGRITPDQAAKLLMLSTERLRQLVKAGYIPRTQDKTYPLVGVVQGYIKFLRDEDRRSSKSAADSGLKASRQREIDMRIAEKRRELVPRAEAEAAMDLVVGKINEELHSLPARVSRDPGMRRQIANELSESVNRVAKHLATGQSALAEGSAYAALAAEDEPG